MKLPVSEITKEPCLVLYWITQILFSFKPRLSPVLTYCSLFSAYVVSVPITSCSLFIQQSFLSTCSMPTTILTCWKNNQHIVVLCHLQATFTNTISLGNVMWAIQSQEPRPIHPCIIWDLVWCLLNAHLLNEWINGEENEWMSEYRKPHIPSLCY